MQKLNIGITVVCALFLILNIVQFVVWRNANIASAEKYTSEIATLEQTINSYGASVTCYTVKSAVKAGDIVDINNITPITFMSSTVTDQHITDTDVLKDKVFKIAINPNTPITSNMLMDEVLEDDARDRDITLDRMTVGISEGDYIDIRMTMPYGDDYIVLSHKRVYAVNDNTIKLYMTELEWATYLGARIDYMLNADYGLVLYADKYVEPGIQQSAVAYYAVPENIASLLSKNPNIIRDTDVDLIDQMKTTRNNLNELLVIFRDELDTVDSDAAKFATGRSAFNTAVNSDRQTERANAEQEENNGSTDDEGDVYTDEIGEDFWEDTPQE